MALHEAVLQIPIVDNHAHPVQELSAGEITESFPTYFVEGDLPPEQARHALHYRAALSLLRERFDVETEAELLEARTAVDLQSYSQEVIGETNTEVILADDGYPETTLAEFKSYTDAEIQPVRRIEPIIEALLSEHDDFTAFEAAFEQRIEQALSNSVSLKSIIAYRTGLDITQPDSEAASEAFANVKEEFDGRIADSTLHEYLLHRATDLAGAAGKPVQLHTGFGDIDAHPRYVDPTYLYEYLRIHQETPVVLLHGGYPYVRSAGYMTSTFPNAYLDVSLAVPFVQHGVAPLLRHVLELTPTTKLLYGSDAFVLPEIYLLAARRIRTDLATVLQSLVNEEYLTADYAETTARRILRENAVNLYDLDI